MLHHAAPTEHGRRREKGVGEKGVEKKHPEEVV